MNTAHSDARRPSPGRPWLQALGFAAPITALVLCLMVKWFALNNPYVTSLYHHDMGPRVPDTRPFSPVTRSRYWMTGLVAAGAVGVLVAGANFILGRLSRRYRSPDWWRVWMLCATPLAIGIPAITMTSNSPTLPSWWASLTAATTLAGLALALLPLPGRVVAERPLEAAFLGLDGLSLSLWLVALPGLEYVPEWVTCGNRLWLWMLVLLPLAGLAGLAILTILRAALRLPLPTPLELSLAALIVTYIVLPIVHHVAFTGGLHYISSMDNFFTRHAWIQLGTFAATAAVVWVTAHARRALLLKQPDSALAHPRLRRCRPRSMGERTGDATTSKVTLSICSADRGHLARSAPRAALSFCVVSASELGVYFQSNPLQRTLRAQSLSANLVPSRLRTKLRAVLHAAFFALARCAHTSASEQNIC